MDLHLESINIFTLYEGNFQHTCNPTLVQPTNF